jgi:hypothetical protein
MKRILLFALFTCLVGNVALAGNNGNGNGAPSGAHYNLNIIGVENPKNSTMTNSNRHTIFVPLKTTGKGVKSVKAGYDGDEDFKVPDMEIHTQIWLMPGEDFRVCDGNGFDLAYGCDDNPLGDWDTCAYVNDEYICGVISKKQGAVFELPCNNNITDDDTDTFVPCDAAVPSAEYEVWSRALGKPNGTYQMTTCATLSGDLMCSTEREVKSRTKGRTLYADVTDELGSMVVDVCVDLVDNVCLAWETMRISLFSGDTKDWFWNYANDGVRLVQLRFYDVQ